MNKSQTIKTIFLLISLLSIFSSFIQFGSSYEIGIFNGMYVNHTYTSSAMPDEVPMTLTFSKLTDDMFHIENELKDPINDVGSWDVNTTTRVISNVVNFGPFDGDHSVFWIYTNISIDDQFMMCNIWKGVHNGFTNGDTLFNVTGEALHGTMAVWQLEDVYGSILWYEKTKGFLVNGTLMYLTDWNNYEFI